ncbi:hypothetical protein DK847_15405 [Aestuariivirga litoralis]|uniref:Uncharacterized protein n=1 Tax=Aestuariivirga litoralis TaxID=2650924 RepID=A0A2W2BIM3_9HYPH|nr:hypothetical protein [Aestuariivirga litoralis]PZF76029.1 hypothetical protein DK847_15405 [Aestuariivirga litoralis]
MNIRLFFGVFVFGIMAMTSALMCATALFRWIGEIHFYWQSGWNFDLPHPVHAGDDSIAPKQASNFDRIVYGWPLRILVFASTYVSMEKLLKQIVFAPPPVNPPPLHKRPAFWLAIVLFALATGLMISAPFIVKSMRHH